MPEHEKSYPKEVAIERALRNLKGIKSLQGPYQGTTKPDSLGMKGQ